MAPFRVMMGGLKLDFWDRKIKVQLYVSITVLGVCQLIFADHGQNANQ